MSPELPSNSHNEAPRESAPGKNMASIVRPLVEKNPEGISEHRRWDDDLARTAESFAAAEAATRILQLGTPACTGTTQSPVSKGPANGTAGAQHSTKQLGCAKQPSHWIQESPELFQTKRIKRVHPRSEDHDDSSGGRTSPMIPSGPRPRSDVVNTVQSMDNLTHGGTTRPLTQHAAIDLDSTTQISGSPHHITLCRVICAKNHESCHNQIYTDEPSAAASNGGRHIAGKCPVANVDKLLKGRPNTLFVVYRDYYCEGDSSVGVDHKQRRNYMREIISIASEGLHAAMESISKFAPDRGSYTGRAQCDYHITTSALTDAPWEYSRRFLYHHHDEILKVAAGPAGSSMMVLSQWLAANPDPMQEECNRLFSQGMVSKATLPWLFSPNSVVVSSEGSLSLAHVLLNFPSSDAQLQLNCWGWAYHQKWLARSHRTHTISVPTGYPTSITSLCIYPLEYVTEATKYGLLSKFWGFRPWSYVAYAGPDYNGHCMYPVNSRFIIDHNTFGAYHPDHITCDSLQDRLGRFDRWPERVPYTANLSKEQLILLPPGIHAFYMQNKTWVHLIPSQIRPVCWNKVGFEQVMLPSRTKNMVKGLVMMRNSRSKSGSSVGEVGLAPQSTSIGGKGNGLAMLFHGGAGTGKTFTADSVAEVAEMPLLRFNYETISASLESTMKILQWAFKLGERWNCILVLDDVEAYQEHLSAEIECLSANNRLRKAVESHRGIVILTSKNTRPFDQSFRSRFQLAVHFPSLEPLSRQSIWHNSLDNIRTSTQQVDYDGISANMEELSMHELNGWQIHNALAMARSLALYDEEVLTWNRLKEAVEVTSTEWIGE
ncbi:hypothetical protein LMH87_000052 [Akanthomyces muscarius]|uniref:AAA+ ATPase domain-containing protein n=1 Tax=Akanthomyces muscarius TaxID=2231603 RepID=A0A9W8UKS0_AKAMU|nr:hypothetical protein LMH87_000052 [Akanthomyces muscarius]KAJ4154773.1 hypothetical protein LMH87_000052 [Akanthomyces muscarius]